MGVLEKKVGLTVWSEVIDREQFPSRCRASQPGSTDRRRRRHQGEDSFAKKPVISSTSIDPMTAPDLPSPR
jgi:hypothetical protein